MNSNSRYGIVRGMGHALPARCVSNEELAATVDTSDEWIRSHTGIKSRYLVGEGESCSTLSIKAGKEALEKSGLSPDQIGMVILATASPDYRGMPSTACLVQEALGLQYAAAFDLGAACSGFVYALEMARSLIVAGTCDHILVIGAEVFSSLLDWSDRNTCVLFGDGAAAAIISLGDSDETRGLQFSTLHAQGSGAGALIVPSGGSKSPFLLGENLNQAEHFLQMDGRKVYNFAVKALVSTIETLLDRAELEKEDIDYIVPHQANVRIIQAAAKRSGVPVEKFFMNLEGFGNTSAASIPLALYDMNKQGLLSKGSKILTIGFGAGLTYGGNYIIW